MELDRDSVGDIGWILRGVLEGDPLERVVARLEPRFEASPLEHEPRLGCWLERDDLGAFSTHKRRGIGVEIAVETEQGACGFTLSSSGNAAIAAGAWSTALGVPCLTFLSDRTDTAKIHAVQQTGATVVVCSRPINFARYAAKVGNFVDLRPSQHPLGDLGYRSYAPEIVRQLGAVPSSVFTFCNSGLTAIGLFEGFSRLLVEGRITTMPQVHAVQCTASEDLARAVDAPLRPQPEPIAGGLGAQRPPRLDRLAHGLKDSGGNVWMVLNEEIQSIARQLADIPLCLESFAAIAGYVRAAATWPVGPRPVVIAAAPLRLTEQTRAEVLSRVESPSSYDEVRSLVERVRIRCDQGKLR